MMKYVRYALATSLFCLLAPSAQAQPQLLTEKVMSVASALTIAQAAYDSCHQAGYHVSVHVVGREGLVLVALRGDGSSPHTFENSMRKAYTAYTFGVPSKDILQRLKDNPAFSVVHLQGVIAGQGGLPIKIGETVVGAVGVSGDGTGENDEVCSQAGIDKLAPAH
jgi:uncharacterized protein GlcG (DUF336 family)